MAYSNWKNPFENNNDIPEVPDDWYVWYNEQPKKKQAATNYQQDFTQEQLNLALMHTQPVYQPRKFAGVEDSWDAANKMRMNPISAPQINRDVRREVYFGQQYEQTKYQYLGEKGRAASGQVFPGMRVPAGPVLSTNKTFPGMVVPNTNARYRANPPISTYGLMGSTIRPDLNSLDSVRRWLAAESLKYGSQGTTFPGVTIPQDRSVNVDTGYRIPTSMPNDNFGNYGGYLSYGGGGGGYSYKPAPKPWYMSLTNWRI